MNRHETYLASTPILTMADLQGYWLHVQDILEGIILPPAYGGDEESMEECIKRRLRYAESWKSSGRCYVRVEPNRDGTTSLVATSVPPKWTSKHVSKHPKWGRCRYE